MPHSEDDYCDLDPTKLCDNCCKCLEKGEAYRVLRADMHLAEMPAEAWEEMEAPIPADAEADYPEAYREPVTLPLDDEDWYDFEDDDDAAFSFGKNVAPLEIDPALLAEWEAKLADIEQSEQPVRKLHGVRRRKTR